MFVAGLLIGFLVVVSPFLVIGLIAIVGIILFAFKDKIDFKMIREEMRSKKTTTTKTEAPNPPPSEAPKSETDKKETKEEEKKKQKITVTIE